MRAILYHGSALGPDPQALFAFVLITDVCNTVLWFVLSSHMISLTNKNTVLPRARTYFLRHSKIVLLFVLCSHMICLTNENTVLLWCRKCFLALLQLHGSSSDIGAYQGFQMPEFFMPLTLNKRTIVPPPCCRSSWSCCRWRPASPSSSLPDSCRNSRKMNYILTLEL